MATKFSKLYDRALSKMNEYSFIQMDDYDIKRVLDSYRRSAQADFARVCEFDLSKTNDDKTAYAEDLTDECLDILALGMVCHWLRTKLANSDILRNGLSTRDFSVYSNANLIKEIRALFESFQHEYTGKINKYSFDHSPCGNASGGG